MYSSVRDRPDAASPGSPGGSGPAGTGTPGGIDPNVVALGATSFFTDISSEMVNAVLPLYLMVHLRFSPLAFGVFDGLYQGMSGVLRIAGGVWADRSGRYKEIAGLGYAMSALGKLGLLLSQAFAPVTAVLLADRTGKGLRTAPRDALISLSSSPQRLAESFGVHRALDTAGALLGPIIAFMLLSAAPSAYQSVFLTSFLVALIGLGVLWCFVQNRPPTGPGGPTPSLRGAVGLLRVGPYRRLVLAGGLLGLVTISDAFLYLTLERSVGVVNSVFPLLFAGTAITYLVLAVPVGRLADRVGRVPVFMAGHGVLVGCYLMLRGTDPSSGVATTLAFLGLLGAYYAATDGVLMAMTSAAVPASVRTSGLALLTTVTALTRFAASLLFGLLWTFGGPDLGVSAFTIALVGALPVAYLLLSKADPADPAAPAAGAAEGSVTAGTDGR